MIFFGVHVLIQPREGSVFNVFSLTKFLPLPLLKLIIMKKYFIFILLMTLAFQGFSQNKVLLFNAKNLDGWTIYCMDPKVNPTSYFYIKDGTIETVGVPNGYLRTKKEYSNYQLHVEWRWPEKPTNSGILVHVNGPDKILPAHYQYQLKSGDAGDIVLHGVGETVTVRDTVFISSEKVKPLIRKEKPSSEKTPGEWNIAEIICKGNTFIFKVNGVVQNTGSKCSLTKGAIGLQAEGSKIQFRNLWLTELK
jgi:hypothetical protein